MTPTRTSGAGGHARCMWRTPGTLRPAAPPCGNSGRAATAEDAVRGKDVVILSVPFERIPDVTVPFPPPSPR
ncbi:NAD(P)-binding domain-containing protein [Streptomyces sp. GDS52]|uniref:NAD(P)-binding domain-containing protein n=2 Tax=Streptomyces TaxID=1883 RepID=UPI003C6EE936